MGIIEKGTISGTLPSKEAFAVHFPGYPSSISRAIETLGGLQGITEARKSISNKLELRFRPEDPYAHPALGEQRPCNGFLLKIYIKKPENQPALATSDVCVEEASPALCADIVARVSESFHFDGMADYQHVIPIHADIARQKKRKWMDLDPLAGNNDLMDLADEDVMMLLPQFFAPKDIPDNLVLKPPSTSGPKKRDDAATQNFYEIDIGPVFAIDFSVKEIPKKLNWEEFVSPSSYHWKWQVSVSELFEERPIWTRDSVVQRLLDKGLKCTHHMLNRYLLRSGYYFSNGPFLRFWIKRGYDPRNDPESRVYQRMEFRVPPELRSYCDANATNNSKPSWSEICAFKLFPFKCQTFLQLFELDDEYIQREIRKPPKQTTCSHKAGWFSEVMLDTLRLRVAVRFVSVFPEPGFEDVFKSIQDEFERSEKIQVQKETFKPSLVKHREATKDSEDTSKCKSATKMLMKIEIMKTWMKKRKKKKKKNSTWLQETMRYLLIPMDILIPRAAPGRIFKVCSIVFQRVNMVRMETLLLMMGVMERFRYTKKNLRVCIPLMIMMTKKKKTMMMMSEDHFTPLVK